MRKTILAALTFTLSLPATMLLAQHHGGTPAPHAKAQTGDGPMGSFSVRAYGQFRLFFQRQDYTPKISLRAARAANPTDAVGALSELRGEISMIDGRYIISYGGGCTNCPPPHDEKAGLLGTARVNTWHEAVLLPDTLEGKALDEFIIAQAKAKGIDTGKPFPVRLSGQLVNVKMHVIEAPNKGFTGHGSVIPMAKQDEFTHERITGLVVGFYAPRSMFAVLTHPGEPFHFHWIDEGRTRTAHLDAFGMEKGASLLLPKN
ncbi:MAG: acetolactate decarboxylase [Beijerinckiaceae bacterium]